LSIINSIFCFLMAMIVQYHSYSHKNLLYYEKIIFWKIKFSGKFWSFFFLLFGPNFFFSFCIIFFCLKLRILTAAHPKYVSLWSRNGNLLWKKFPPIKYGFPCNFVNNEITAVNRNRQDSVIITANRLTLQGLQCRSLFDIDCDRF
jgi:hypothetical protein